ncbi:MAG: alpha/beta hydrolase [Rickettsia endosymbiont of Bryobia graminum]|nr:alpha/beta hydrolase [Rickettsia endosymbiont of Bryobia graminum]
MYKINTIKNQYITYNQYKSTKKNTPLVVFLHGLMSNMNGKKSHFIHEYCKKQDYNYITFDNFGHGKSSGHFIDQTIGSWLTGLELVLNELVNNQCILVGSSMGGWLALLAAMKFPDKIKAIVGIASAPDFTEELIWNKLPDTQKKQMEQFTYLPIKGNKCQDVYLISHQLIIEARKHLLLNNGKINLTIPIHLIHGMLDCDVPYSIANRLLEKLSSDSVVMKLIKDGDHRLSRDEDLIVIANSIEELINIS